jgi:Protein of unknown function (DUF4065)
VAYSEAKLKELVVYIASKSADDPNFGKTKLLKLLAYSDFRAYQRRGESISGATYIKLEHGPAPREGKHVLKRLRATERIDIVDEDVFGYTQNRVVAKDDPDTDVFDAAELEIVDEVLTFFWKYNNSEMRDLSHRDFVAWGIVNEKDEIPYETVYLTPRSEPTAEELTRIHDLVRQADAARAAGQS